MPSHSSIEIVLDRPDALLTPGDSITGTLTLNSLGVVKVDHLYVSLTGSCRTDVLNGRPASGYGSYKSRSETVEFLRLVSDLDKKSVYSPGEYSFPFSILVPGNCTNPRANLESKGLDTSWTTTPLPSTHGTDSALIEYYIKGVCKQQEILSKALQCQIPVTLVSLAASHHQLLPENHIETCSTLKFYDRKRETWGQWSKRLVGVGTQTDQTVVQLVLDVAQSVRADHNPLDYIKKLYITAPRGDFEVRELTFRIVYSMEIIAKLYIKDLAETKDIYHDEYVPRGDNGNLLPLQDGGRLDFKALRCCESTPNWTTTAFLEATVKVQPVSGSPIVPVVISARAPFESFYSLDGDLSDISKSRF